LCEWMDVWMECEMLQYDVTAYAQLDRASCNVWFLVRV
jgi:hypothetical protein